eukprot:4666235-Amphidinium_carterae.3
MSTIYIMAYVDDLLVVGDNATTQPFLQQFQQHLERKHKSHLTKTTPLEFLGKTIELLGNIHLSFAQPYYNKIFKAYNADKCNPSTIPGNKKPPIAAQPLDKEQHSKYQRTTLKALDSSGTTLMGLTIESRHCFCGQRVEQVTSTTRE